MSMSEQTLPVSCGSVEYRHVEGWPGYAVGSDGSVWSCQTFGKGSKPDWSHWRKMKLYVGRCGHQFINLCKSGKHRTTYVHEIIAIAFLGPRPNGMQCCHYNGDGGDNRPSNLRWGTSDDNQQDKIRHGRSPRGIRHWKSKLTNDDVRSIRSSRINGATLDSLSKLYGVSIGGIR